MNDGHTSILLATGFDAQRPGGKLVDGLQTQLSLPCAKCGFPIVDTHLRWHPQFFGQRCPRGAGVGSGSKEHLWRTASSRPDCLVRVHEGRQRL